MSTIVRVQLHRDQPDPKCLTREAEADRCTTLKDYQISLVWAIRQHPLDGIPHTLFSLATSNLRDIFPSTSSFTGQNRHVRQFSVLSQQYHSNHRGVILIRPHRPAPSQPPFAAPKVQYQLTFRLRSYCFPRLPPESSPLEWHYPRGSSVADERAGGAARLCCVPQLVSDR